MSKAFTSEETPESGPVTRAPPTLAPGEVRYITPEGHAALRESLAKLKDERAAATGLPETERGPVLADLDQKIAFTEATLAAVTVLGPKDAPADRVAFATWVTVEDEDGETSTWRIVGPDETDVRRGLVSVHSPVARALMGHGVGDTVEVQRPGGKVELTIVAVWTSPPDAHSGR